VTEILIPDPSLVVLIGAAGAGKTTFARRHFDPSEILSSDRYRALIAGNEADQSVTRAAFGRLHRELTRRLEDHQTSVVDATNVERQARRAVLKRSIAAGIPAVAIVFDLPVEVVLARNASRLERVVDEPVVRKHLARLRWYLDELDFTLDREGFSQVVVLRRPDEVDAVRVVRTGPRAAERLSSAKFPPGGR
jgi:predicted kinase